MTVAVNRHYGRLRIGARRAHKVKRQCRKRAKPWSGFRPHTGEEEQDKTKKEAPVHCGQTTLPKNILKTSDFYSFSKRGLMTGETVCKSRTACLSLWFVEVLFNDEFLYTHHTIPYHTASHKWLCFAYKVRVYNRWPVGRQVKRNRTVFSRWKYFLTFPHDAQDGNSCHSKFVSLSLPSPPPLILFDLLYFDKLPCAVVGIHKNDEFQR